MWRRTPAAQLFDVWRILPLCQRVAQMLRTRVSQLFERKREMCGLFIFFFFFFENDLFFFLVAGLGWMMRGGSGGETTGHYVVH
jgi:hypothetical protein